jgi:hypothetical protein
MSGRQNRRILFSLSVTKDGEVRGEKGLTNATEIIHSR